MSRALPAAIQARGQNRRHETFCRGTGQEGRVGRRKRLWQVMGLARRFRVVVADEDQGFCHVVAGHIAATPRLELVAAVHDGRRALEAVAEQHPDLLVLDLFLPSLDGLEVLQALQCLEERPRVVVLTAIAPESLIARAAALGADYYIMKPFHLPTLMQRFCQLADGQSSPRRLHSEQRRQQIEREVTHYIALLGVPPHYKGYAYLREAVTMVVEEPGFLAMVTKALYPSVAERFSTSPHKVERAIRSAIEATWTRGNLACIHELFAHTVDVNKGKPTNSSFIARLADHVRMQMRAG